MRVVMNKIIGLLLVVGLVAAAYVNREKIAALRGGSPEEAEVSEESGVEVAPPSPPNLTPHPARESQAQATKLYPGLGIPGSPLNKKFLALHAEARSTDPALLARPDWPLTLAERAMVALGGVPLPRNAPAAITPKPLPGSALDQKPKK